MRKLLLNKQLLLAGSIMIAASACQCQKNPETQGNSPSYMEENGSCEEEEEDTCKSSPAMKREPANSPTVQIKNSSQESAEKAAETPATSAAGASEKPVETPKLEAVKGVSENALPLTSPQN